MISNYKLKAGSYSNSITLFDYLLKKHSGFYEEMRSTTGPSLPVIKGETKKFNSRIGSFDEGSITGEDEKESFARKGAMKEDSLRVVYRDPDLTHQPITFRMKVVPLMMQDSLLAISLQDVSLNEEEAQRKRVD